MMKIKRWVGVACIAFGVFNIIWGAALIGSHTFWKTSFFVSLIGGFVIIMSGLVVSGFLMDREIENESGLKKIKKVVSNFGKSQDFWILAFAVLALVGSGWFLTENLHKNRFPKNIHKYAQVGDFFAGSVGTILSFFTLFFVVQQKGETEKRDERRERAQLERDNLEWVKLDLESFRLKVDALNSKLEGLSIATLKGKFAIQYYCDPSKFPFGVYPTPWREESEDSKRSLVTLVKGIDSIFYEVFADIHMISKIASNDLSPSGYKMLQQKYELLTTKFDADLIKACDRVLTKFSGDQVDYPFEMYGAMIRSLKEYLDLNNEDYPHFYGTNEILKIFQMANYYHNSQFNPYTRDKNNEV